MKMANGPICCSYYRFPNAMWSLVHLDTRIFDFIQRGTLGNELSSLTSDSLYLKDMSIACLNQSLQSRSYNYQCIVIHSFIFFCYASIFFFWDKIKDIITILKGADVSWSKRRLPYKKHCIFLCDKNNTKWEYRAQNERRLKIGHFWHLSRLNLSVCIFLSLVCC